MSKSTVEAIQKRSYRKALDTVLAAAYAQANGHERCKEINEAIMLISEVRRVEVTAIRNPQSAIPKGSEMPVVEIGRVEPRASKENATALSASLGEKAYFQTSAN